MAKKHWILIASVAAGLAVGAPAAMAAPELPGLPGAPVGQPSSATCTDDAGTADVKSDQTALQLPIAGAAQGNDGNCQSAGNEKGNGVAGNGAFPGVAQ
jgi:hypothetical protein